MYNNPPLWKAYLACVQHFRFDSLMDGLVGIEFPDLPREPGAKDIKTVIIERSPERIVTQDYWEEQGEMVFMDKVNVFFQYNPPSHGIRPEALGFPKKPLTWEPIEGRLTWPKGEELLRLVKEIMGDQGLVGVECGTTKLIHTEEEIYDFADHPHKYYEKRDHLLSYYTEKFKRLMALDCKPDFLCLGASGTLIHQSLNTFRELALPIVQRVSRLAKEEGIPTHIHSCGPQKQLVKVIAEETDVTVIDPLEPGPMGDCDLQELKELYGDRLVLKGNLHTTEVMLHGNVQMVKDAAKRAIDQGAAGGRFILSTGDQCGRDTPEENIHALIEVAKTYGKY